MEFKEEYRLKRQLREILALRQKHDSEVNILRIILELRRETMGIPSHIMNRPYSNVEILAKVAVIRVLRKELDRIRATLANKL
jgi:hypothetical protein